MSLLGKMNDEFEINIQLLYHKSLLYYTRYKHSPGWISFLCAIGMFLLGELQSVKALWYCWQDSQVSYRFSSPHSLGHFFTVLTLNGLKYLSTGAQSHLQKSSPCALNLSWSLSTSNVWSVTSSHCLIWSLTFFLP